MKTIDRILFRLAAGILAHLRRRAFLRGGLTAVAGAAVMEPQNIYGAAGGWVIATMGEDNECNLHGVLGYMLVEDAISAGVLKEGEDGTE